MASRPVKTTAEFDPSMVAEFAREFADWRLGGCPGYGFHAEFRARVEKAARRHGRSYADLMTDVHREAYRIIDAAHERDDGDDDHDGNDHKNDNDHDSHG